MKPSERLRRARESAGKTTAEVAQMAGIPEPHYYDLETYDDDLYMTASLAELRNLAFAVGLTIRGIFGVEGTAAMGLAGLAEAVRHHLVKEGVSIQEFGQRAGWDLTKFIEKPQTAWEDWNFDCLYDVCRQLGVSWIDILPDEA
jgi:transcriptional regulator with XRE-family HTH domain